MATLVTGYNAQYSENASVLTGNPNRVTVEVEDSVDKQFWEDLLTELCPQKDFHFDPYHTELKGDGFQRTGKGKSRIIKASHDYNDWHIGCVDSDYDWLLSDATDDGKIMVDNKYLLQTYAYSIENLLCLPSTLRAFCREITGEDTEFDFNDYICKLSHVVHPLLVWSVYLYSKGNHDFTLTAWRSIIISDINDEKESLSIIEQRVHDRLDELNKRYAMEVANKNALMQALLTEKNMTAENAFLFVRGHELFDHVVNILLRSIIPILRQNHYRVLRDSDSENREALLGAYQKKDQPVEKLLKRNYRYKDKTPIYDRIKNDVEMIWN